MVVKDGRKGGDDAGGEEIRRENEAGNSRRSNSYTPSVQSGRLESLERFGVWICLPSLTNGAA